MAQFSPLETAEQELQSLGVAYRLRKTRDKHWQIFIDGCPIIVVSGDHKSGDVRVIKNVKRDIRVALSRRNTGTKMLYGEGAGNGRSEKMR